MLQHTALGNLSLGFVGFLVVCDFGDLLGDLMIPASVHQISYNHVFYLMDPVKRVAELFSFSHWLPGSSTP